MKKTLTRIGRFPTFCLLLITLLSFFGDYHYLLELLSHFRVQYIALFLLSFVFFLIFFNKKWLLIALLGLLLNISMVVGIYLPKNRAVNSDTRSTPHSITVMLSNVFTANQQHQRLIDTINHKEPDVIVLEEINQRWVNALQVLNENYPYQQVIPEEDNFGIGVYSKYPLDYIQILDFTGNGIASISASVVTDHTTISLIATHPLPPMSDTAARQQTMHFNKLVSHIVSATGPIMVVGDLNTTLWSSRYKKLIREANLDNARQGVGVLPSWSLEGYLGLFFKLPLDHILISNGLAVSHFEILQDVGSDHLPVLAKINY